MIWLPLGILDTAYCMKWFKPFIISPTVETDKPTCLHIFDCCTPIRKPHVCMLFAELYQINRLLVVKHCQIILEYWSDVNGIFCLRLFRSGFRCRWFASVFTLSFYTRLFFIRWQCCKRRINEKTTFGKRRRRRRRRHSFMAISND